LIKLAYNIEANIREFILQQREEYREKLLNGGILEQMKYFCDYLEISETKADSEFMNAPTYTKIRFRFFLLYLA
jgi:hypothetical protein